ncbi:type II secretion system F family protein [Actinokineospora sp. UTMC 2448]|uniref:type II secretion system F family protein n=1 Tax=Actinokineospora sp. UTMC 2448 TaxID=2268449 RepID=UPI002164B14C|nr:type II secretion system F family protein [Actinokineospora sp. UTMC 2448]UVS76603.1 Flp pilus assembly protein TadB [Actinokineospora sp. UTMC 2448]
MTAAVAPLLLAAAIGVWPADVARRRLRALQGDRASPRTLRLPESGALAPVLLALLAWAVLGPAGAVAALVLAVLVRGASRRRKRMRAALVADDGLAESLRAMVAELRAGATPVAAAESAAEDAPQEVAVMLRSAAAAARLGGQPPLPESSTAATQIIRAWQLATHHGLPLAAVLDAVRVDLEQRTRFARQVDARMSGTRASACVLVCLPGVALLLGQTAGADPLAVLADTTLGQLLLLVGAAFAAVGLRWSERITRTTERPT